MVRAKNGSDLYSSAAMPEYWAPCPLNMNTTCGRPATAVDWADARSYVWSNWFFPRAQFGIRGLLTHTYLGGDLNGSLWTLPYEIGCYVLLALAGWLGLTRSPARGARLAGSAILALYVFDVVSPAHALFFKNDGRVLAAWFVVGALAALVPEAGLKRALSPVVVAALALAWAVSWWCGGQLLTGLPAISALALWASWSLPLRAVEERLGGDYSYGLYIYGYPVQQMLAEFGVVHRGIAVYFTLSLLITLALAIGSWHLVEKHALRLKSLLAGSTPKPSIA